MKDYIELTVRDLKEVLNNNKLLDDSKIYIECSNANTISEIRNITCTTSINNKLALYIKSN